MVDEDNEENEDEEDEDNEEEDEEDEDNMDDGCGGAVEQQSDSPDPTTLRTPADRKSDSKRKAI